MEIVSQRLFNQLQCELEKAASQFPHDRSVRQIKVNDSQLLKHRGVDQIIDIKTLIDC